MFLASAPTALALTSFTSLFNNGTLILYSGTPPATAETALSGNTALATYTFSAAAFGAVTLTGGFDVQTASFVASSVNPGNTGVATFGRANFTPSAWGTSTGYTRGKIVSSSSNYYACIVSGTSDTTTLSGTSLGLIDGTAAWEYIGPTTGGTCLCQVTVGTTNSDVLMANTSLQVGVSAIITSLQFQIPVN